MGCESISLGPRPPQQDCCPWTVFNDSFIVLPVPGKEVAIFNIDVFFLPPQQPFNLSYSVTLADPGVLFVQSSCYLLRTVLKEK